MRTRRLLPILLFYLLLLHNGVRVVSVEFDPADTTATLEITVRGGGVSR